MTAADELRTAAEKLRTRAAAAAEDSGNTTWHASRHFPELPHTTYTTVWATAGTPLLRGGGGRGRPHPYVSAPVGDYIAAMDPGVGLGLASLLEAVAFSTAETHECVFHCTPGTCELASALTVARVINGSQP